MADDQYEQYHEVVRRVLGARADRVLADPAWAALGATLARVERAGYDPVTVLGRAVDQGQAMTNARSIPALLTWRINQELPARPGTAVPTPAASPATSASVPSSRTAEPAARTGDGIPGWRERPFGAVGDADLQARISDVQAEATRAGIVARQAREAATVALEVARSRRGPAHTAVTERHAELSSRVQAMDALAKLETEYKQVRQIGGFGSQTPDELRARLAVSEARLRERTLFGLLPAVRGEYRRELTEQVKQLRDYTENAGPRLTELDARRAELEKQAGPAATRESAYREWLVMDRELPQRQDEARAGDVEAARQMHRDADRLTTWAQDRAEEHDQVVTEAATRRTLPAERAGTEQSERAAAAVEAVAAVAVAVAAEAAAEAAAGYVVEAVAEEVSRGRSA